MYAYEKNKQYSCSLLDIGVLICDHSLELSYVVVILLSFGFIGLVPLSFD